MFPSPRLLPSLLFLALALGGNVHAKSGWTTGLEQTKPGQWSLSFPASGSKIRFNRAKGRYEQRVRVKNDTGATINGFLLEVSHIGKNVKLLNGSRTPTGGIYQSNRSLAPGKSVTVILRYHPKRQAKPQAPRVHCRLLIPPSELVPDSGTAVTTGTVTTTSALTEPGCLTVSLGASDSFLAAQWLNSLFIRNIDSALLDRWPADPEVGPAESVDLPFAFSMIETGAGSLPALEFQTEPGKQYQVLYSDDQTTWKTSVEIIPHSDAVSQWLDSGPPLTDSLPADGATRLYRIAPVSRDRLRGGE